MKKLLVSTMAFAALATTDATARNHGPYIGAAVASIVGHHDGTLGNTAGPIVERFGLSKYTVGLDVLLGYAWQFNSFVVGLEFDYLFGNSNTSYYKFASAAGLDDWNMRLHTSGAFGAAFKFGFQCTDRVLAYIRLGLENRRFRVSANVFSLNAAQVAANQISSSTTKTAFAPGLGIQMRLNCALALGLEYREVAFGKITGSLTSVNGTTTTSVRPRVSTILLSLTYNFWG